MVAGHILALTLGLLGLIGGVISWVVFTRKGQTRTRWINVIPVGLGLFCVALNLYALLA